METISQLEYCPLCEESHEVEFRGGGVENGIRYWQFYCSRNHEVFEKWSDTDVNGLTVYLETEDGS